MLENMPPALGHALSDVRAGLDKTLFLGIDAGPGRGALVLASLAFADHRPIPERYTADGAGLSPPLSWTGVPAQAASVVLVVEDADSPTPLPLVHAIAVDLPGEDGALAEAALGGADASAPSVALGRNSLLLTSWLPPDPPPGHGVHRYAFQVFALAAGEALGGGIGREALALALAERTLASGLLCSSVSCSTSRNFYRP